MIWHRSHIGFTEARTFISGSFCFEVAVSSQETDGRQTGDGPWAERGMLAILGGRAKPEAPQAFRQLLRDRADDPLQALRLGDLLALGAKFVLE